MDIIIRNARISDKESLKDVAVKDGKIIKIEENIAEKGNEEIDADVQNRRQAHRGRDSPEGAVKRGFQRGRHRFKLWIELLERGQGGEMTDGVEMGDGRQNQNRHAAIYKIQWITGRIEEENIGQSQHHPRHRHRNQRQEMRRCP